MAMRGVRGTDSQVTIVLFNIPNSVATYLVALYSISPRYDLSICI
jgi:hypothetical protein